jgi:Protein of unknown function (DUF3071)
MVEKLHFVGFTRDSDALMLSHRDDATSGEYFVEIDDYLVAAIGQFDGEDDDADGDQEDTPGQATSLPSAPAPAPPPPTRTYPKPASDLSPREIQARLRSGNSIADVADEAGVDEEWVLRFADPIIAEQARVVEQAQRLTFNKPRVGPSSQPLRASVRRNLADQGALRDDEVFDAGWSAYNLRGARWVVRLSFVAKRRRKIAEWEVDLREGELWARNRVATDLGYVEPGRRLKRGHDEFPKAALPSRRAGRPKVKKSARTAKAPRKKAVVKTAASSRRAGSGRKAAPRKALHKSAAGAAKRASVRKAPLRTPARTTTKKAAKKRLAKKVTKRPAGRATAKRATKKATTKKAPSKGPTGPTLGAVRPSHLARPPSPISQASRGTPATSQTGPWQSSTAPSPPVPQPVEPPVRAAKRPAPVKAAPQRNGSPARPYEPPPPPPTVAPRQEPPATETEIPPRPSLVIMSTPEAHLEDDRVEKGSRWPLPRRRR